MYVKLHNESVLASCPESVKQRFWGHVQRSEVCWTWTKSKTARYGKFRWKGMEFQINRAAWIISNGVIPEGLFVCHKCDNTKCVNPSHLWLGTHSDNMKDAYNKGRVPSTKGIPKKFTNRGNHKFPRKKIKLQAENIPHIRSMRKNGFKLREIAEKYGVTHGLITDILSGRVWKHIP